MITLFNFICNGYCQYNKFNKTYLLTLPIFNSPIVGVIVGSFNIINKGWLNYSLFKVGLITETMQKAKINIKEYAKKKGNILNKQEPINAAQNSSQK